MELLMTPPQVAAEAFAGSLDRSARFIPQSAILSAQQKFIKPVLNGLYDRLAQGLYPEFLQEYVVPALAQYVRYLVLPAISVQVGTIGIIQAAGSNFDSASEKSVLALRRRAQKDAAALMKRAVEHIEASANDYPEYDPRQNAMNRVSMDGNVIL